MEMYRFLRLSLYAKFVLLISVSNRKCIIKKNKFYLVYGVHAGLSLPNASTCTLSRKSLFAKCRGGTSLANLPPAFFFTALFKNVKDLEFVIEFQPGKNRDY